MKSYGGLERQIARWLESAPFVRNSVKALYHRVNYLWFRERSFQIEVHPAARLANMMEWLGQPKGEAENFFGYYDKSPWSADMHRVILHRLDDGEAEIVAFDRKNGGVTVLGRSTAWNHQQGSMAQWLPTSHGTKVIYNDYAGGRLIARIAGIDGGEEVVPIPIQAVHPRSAEALSLNYKRLLELRQEYGYLPAASNFKADQSYDCDGVWRVDLDSGDHELMITLADLIANEPRKEMDGSRHKVNHIIYSPQGSHFVFMHRWIGPQGKFSRLYVAASDGSGLKLLLDDRMVSHYNWFDEDHVLAWARTEEHGDRYYLIDVRSGERSIVGAGILDPFGDGHPSYSPDRRWIVTDTYPDRARQRHLLLYEVSSGKCIKLARVFAPWRFDGPVRCDLHPRWSPDGSLISIDSAHDGIRRSYVIDVRAIVYG